ncbi:MAG: hypothetical protein P1U82_20520 [Verrucomicrobiales bacterium]|jgi:hypothetical protein|nr:hypothetical protein [Verrucomicrobiales bacterium]
MVIIKMKLFTFYSLAAVACAFAFLANQANVSAQEKAPESVEVALSFWIVVGTKAYIGGEEGVNEPSMKPSYDELATAWLQ